MKSDHGSISSRSAIIGAFLLWFKKAAAGRGIRYLSAVMEAWAADSADLWRDRGWWHVSSWHAGGKRRRYQLMASKENRRVAGRWSKAPATCWGLFSPRAAGGWGVGGFGYNSCPHIARKQPPRGIKCEDLDWVSEWVSWCLCPSHAVR